MTCVDPWFHGPACDGSCAESPHGTRESGRVASSDSDTRSIELGTSEAARSGNSERPLDPQLDVDESRPKVSVSAPPQDGLRTAALELLACHRDAIQREKRTRLYLIIAARERGLTHAEIGDALGMTEAGVRRAIDRAGGTV